MVATNSRDAVKYADNSKPLGFLSRIRFQSVFRNIAIKHCLSTSQLSLPFLIHSTVNIEDSQTCLYMNILVEVYSCLLYSDSVIYSQNSKEGQIRLNELTCRNLEVKIMKVVRLIGSVCLTAVSSWAIIATTSSNQYDKLAYGFFLSTGVVGILSSGKLYCALHSSINNLSYSYISL